MRQVKDIHVEDLNTLEELNAAELDVMRAIAKMETQLEDSEEDNSPGVKLWRRNCNAALRLSKITLRAIEQKEETFYE
jgi:predicted ATP-dependent protease